MGERALAACHDKKGHYDLFRTQWTESERLVNAAARGECPRKDAAGDDQWRRCGRNCWPDIVDELDYLQLDLCLRCYPDGVSSYLPVWTGIPTTEGDETDISCGVLLRVESQSELTRLRDQIRREKERLGDAIERGAKSRRDAQQSLLCVGGARERYLSASASERLWGSE
ncbi:hypothetical protein [Halovenus sp. HT40]|uniref:hypothetical protein n=1 Tax=Halovenus sp. HT40 TaxID=3126691 RepID=UPI00300EC92B